MTNLPLVVTLWVNLVTNPVPAGVTADGQNFYAVSSVSTVAQYLPDGGYLNCSALANHSFVTNTVTLSRTPPLPTRLSAIRSAQLDSGQVAGLANGGPDLDNFCLMFQTRALTKTNFIYGLESTHDFVNWMLMPPEIDGTGAEESFFDECLTNELRVYRIASRPGILPQ